MACSGVNFTFSFRRLTRKNYNTCDWVNVIQDVAKRTHLGKMVTNVMFLRYGYILDHLNNCWFIYLYSPKRYTM